jgi:hypothetical protein
VTTFILSRLGAVYLSFFRIFNESVGRCRRQFRSRYGCLVAACSARLRRAPPLERHIRERLVVPRSPAMSLDRLAEGTRFVTVDEPAAE